MNGLQTKDAGKLLDIVFDPTKVVQKWDAVDKIEGYIATLPRQMGDIEQKGTPGLYIRKITIPTGTLITSKIHRCKHPYHISAGSCVVYNTQDDSQTPIFAPYDGITEPGTRRVIYVFDTIIWTIYVPTARIKDNFDLLSEEEQERIFEQVIEDITLHYDNPELIGFDDGIFI